MAKVVSVNISEKKGERKRPVPKIHLKLRHGIVGDAHAGDWHRQISLLAEESIEPLRAVLPDLPPGAFAENITTEGIVLNDLLPGTRLRLGEAEVEVTQIGKECHSDCEIKRLTGKCVMPTEGVFAVVVREGTVRKGDEIFQAGQIVAGFKFLIMLSWHAKTIRYLLLCFVTRFACFTKPGGEKSAKFHNYPLAQRKLCVIIALLTTNFMQNYITERKKDNECNYRNTEHSLHHAAYRR